MHWQRHTHGTPRPGGLPTQNFPVGLVKMSQTILGVDKGYGPLDHPVQL